MSARLHASNANSAAVRKKIENHRFEDEEGEEYVASNFGGFTSYFRRKKAKLQNLDVEIRSNAGDVPVIFRGVVAHVNGYTQPSLNDLHRMVVTHGGGFLQYLDGKTTATHIIASTLTPKKRVEFRRYRIVKPAWIVDSIVAGKLLPWDRYRVLDEGHGQKVLGYDNGKMVSQKNEEQCGYKEQTKNSWYTDQIKQAVDVEDEEHDPVEGLVSPQSQAMEQLGPKADSLAEMNYSSARLKESPGELNELFSERALFRTSSLIRETTDLRQEHFASRENSSLSSDEAAEESRVETAGDETMSRVPTVDFSKAEKLDDEFGSELYEDAFSALQGVLKRSASIDSSPPPKRTKVTAEEHNSLLLTDPNFRKSSAINPDFIRQYYSESRLHHLSTWKAEIKAQIQRMTAIDPPSKPLRELRDTKGRRYILHVDFDSFFAAVSLKSAPQYKDQPVVVAHGAGQGSEIASCNYPARQFGIKNGMWMKNALKMCPQLKVLPYDFKGYEEASKEFYKAIIETGAVVQSVSVDEALVDVTAVCLSAGESDGMGTKDGSIEKEQERADQIAFALRQTIKERTGCEVSVGIGGNILLAKVALRRAKPAGQHHLKPEAVLDFLGELTVQALPGVARSIGGKLEELGVTLVKDVRNVSREKLISVLGPKTGERMWDYSRGIDRTEVGPQTLRKSVSAEVNWGIRFETQAQAEEFVRKLCAELHDRLVKQRAKGKQLTLKIMKRSADAPLDPPKHLGHGKCDTFNRSVVLGVATNTHEVLAREAMSMLTMFRCSPGELRGIGLQMTRLEPMKAGEEAGEEKSSQAKLLFIGVTTARSVRGPEADDSLRTEANRKSSIAQPDPVATKTLEPRPKGDEDESRTNPAASPPIHPRILAEVPPDTKSSSGQPRPARIDRPARPPSGTIQLSTAPIRPQTARTAGTIDRYATPSRSSSLAPDNPLPSVTRLPADQVDGQHNALSSKQKDMPSIWEPATHTQPPFRIREFSSSPSRRSHKNTPTKKQPGLLSRGEAGKLVNHHSSLVQSNLISQPITLPQKKQDTVSTRSGHEPSNEHPPTVQAPDKSPSHISPSYLNALPASVQQEVLSQQRRDRLFRRHGNLLMPANNPFSRRPPPPRPRHSSSESADERGPARLRLAPRPAKASFTSRKLCTLPELRRAMSEWVAEFASDGPYDEDLQALVRYLTKIVGAAGQEMEKAVALVRWLDWLVAVGNDAGADADHVAGGAEVVGVGVGVGMVSSAWHTALDKIKKAVQDAVRARGLGPVEF
ncbi:MAG: deoxycytidyl transferase [Phylliscum demangeonii]|nr:MAG: deoxycytidyl transferase [Phylliscum demangeonii]